MALILGPRVKDTTTSTGTVLTLTGVAPTGFQTFGTAVGNGNTTTYCLLDANGSAWEEGIGTYASSGTTLTRTTVLRSSNSNAAISLTAGTHTVFGDWTSFHANTSALANRAFIEGGILSRTSTTVVAVSACTVSVNNAMYTIAAASYTSASTMKDLNNATVTLGASKCYHVYAYNNSGTGEIRIQDYADGTWGGAPTFDTTLDYWKSPSAAGANARRIGKFWTNASSQVVDFKIVEYDRRLRRYETPYSSAVSAVSNGTATTFAGGSVTITPYYTADDDGMVLFVSAGASTAPTAAATYISLDGSTIWRIVSLYASATSQNQFVWPALAPYSGTLNYLVTANGIGNVWFAGFTQRV